MAKTTEAKLEASYKHWRLHPRDWVSDKFSQSIADGRIRMSTQQWSYFRELTNVVNAKMWKRLETLGREVKLGDNAGVLLGYKDKLGISIMAGAGVGKDFITALTILWFLDVFPKAKVVAAGASAKHLRNVLWAEISKVSGLANRADAKDPLSKSCLDVLFNFGVERIENKGSPPDWFAEAVTINKTSTREEQAGTLQGRHGEFMLIVIDEAAETPEPVFTKLEATMTFPVNFALMIFNPTRTHCYAVNSHMDVQEREKWVCLQWNAEESELVTKSSIAAKVSKGKDSYEYRVYVLGLPPLVNANTLIVPEWVYDSCGRELYAAPGDAVLAGVDVGGGGDYSVMCIRHGPKVLKWLYYSDKNTMAVVDWVKVNMDIHNVRCAFIDVIGLGSGVYYRLQELGANVRAFDSRQKARQEEKYFNRRAEAFMLMRQRFEEGLICLPDDTTDEIKRELCSMGFDPSKRCQIDSKDEIRRVLGHSPDAADALAYTFAFPDEVFRESYDNSYSRPIVYPRMGII